MAEKKLTEENNLIKEVRKEIRQIDDINHRIYCVNAIMDLMYQASQTNQKNASNYISSINICSWALENVQQDLDMLYENVLQILRDYEQ
mgnify:CR=1 FL=1